MYLTRQSGYPLCVLVFLLNVLQIHVPLRLVGVILWEECVQVLNFIVEFRTNPAIYRENKLLVLSRNGHFYIITEPIAVQASIVPPKFDLVNLIQTDSILHGEFVNLTTLKIVTKEVVQLGGFGLLALGIVQNDLNVGVSTCPLLVARFDNNFILNRLSCHGRAA